MINDKGEEVGIIYGWYNTLTDMWYVGQTINQEGRFNCHIRLSLNNDNTHFHRALRKYGLENFVYCILEDNVLRDNLNMKEQEWIEYYDSFYDGYNMTAGGDGTLLCVPWNKGKHHSEETIKKMSKSLKGRFIGENNPFYGKHHSIESRKKNSEAHKGRKAKKVNQYDKEGNFVHQWDSMGDIKRAGFKANICYCCQGKIPYANGFIWKYA